MKRRIPFILFLLATIVANTSLADNYFYIDDITLAPNDVGKTIEIPVKAHFDTRVSEWYVSFTFPEGLSVSAGYDYVMPDGNTYYICGRDIIHNDTTSKRWHENIAEWFSNQSINNYQDNLSHIYAQFDTHWSGMYWEAGDYDEMIMLQVHVEYDVYGEISINSQTVLSIQAGNTGLETNILNVDEACDRYDVNRDGCINIADATEVYYHLASYDEYDMTCDCNRDGINDISDAAAILDMLIYEDGYEPYYAHLDYGVDFASTTSTMEVLHLSGDLDGDGVLGISDVTGIIDLILSGNGWEYWEADVNGDGQVNIVDVTTLIDILLNNH